MTPNTNKVDGNEEIAWRSCSRYAYDYHVMVNSCCSSCKQIKEALDAKDAEKAAVQEENNHMLKTWMPGHSCKEEHDRLTKENSELRSALDAYGELKDMTALQITTKIATLQQKVTEYEKALENIMVDGCCSCDSVSGIAEEALSKWRKP